MTDDLTRLVTELSERIDRLERAAPKVPPGPRVDLDGPAPATGMVGYRGEVDLAGPLSWSITYGAANVLDLDHDRMATVLAALGHPARLAIVAMLLGGGATSAALQDGLGEGSSGQLYHHLRSLTSAGVIAKSGRNDYRVLASAVVPLLVLMLASADVGGLLPTSSATPSFDVTDRLIPDA